MFLERSRRIKPSYKMISYPVILIVILFLGYLVVQPLRADIHYRRAQQQYSNMDWKQAIAEYERAISMQPLNSQYHFELARIYSRLANLRRDRNLLIKAIQGFRTALQLNPYDGLVHSHLGWTYKQHKMYGGAVEELNRAIELDPTNVSFHWRLASIYRVKGNLKKAKKEFEIILDISPNQQATQLALAQINKRLKVDTQ